MPLGRTFSLTVFFTAVTIAQDYPRVEPILRAKCYACHGATQQVSGLRLDDRKSAMDGGYSGPVILPGKAAQSKLMQRVEGAKGVMRMPPGAPLTAGEIEALRGWIDRGAEWPESKAVAAGVTAKAKPKHWAFQPVVKPAVPAVAGAKTAIDAFVLERLRKENVAPSPEAEKTTLARRVHLDITGLLPTAAEVNDFLNDERPDAYERMVDRLLDSPHYGERWARPWLDRARYADSDGYEKDWIRPYAWRYRQWVIDALNGDMPFDRFTIEQIAGDLLPGATVEQKVATGFHRMTLTNREGGIDNRQFAFETAVDRAVTVSQAWLGLTAGCAQCHDHKYDPISQKEFYQLYAFFDGLEEVDIDAPMAGELGPYLASRDEYRAKREELLKQYRVAELQASWEEDMRRAAANPGERTDWDLAWDCLLKLSEGGDGAKIIHIPPEKRTQREKDVLTDHFIRNYHFAVGQQRADAVKFKELDEKLRGLKESYPQLTQAMAVKEGAAHKSYLRVRGDYAAPGIEVTPGVPAALPALEVRGRATRLDLAKWVASGTNPLTARVAVNWVWQELFGQGLVKSADDFGTRGDRPAYPELLDWLAVRFVESGWSMKQLVREIVLSSTYRQSSNVREDLKDRDPENTLLARQNRVRLPAELLRDAALRASGLLSLRVGGESVMPPQPAGVAELGYGNRGWRGGWVESKGADKYRRGLYVHFQRSTPHPMLMNFDAPKANVALCRRERSNTPLQALNLLNDPVFFEAAQALGYQAMESGEDWTTRLDTAFERALSRKPTAGERRKFEAFFARQKKESGEAGAWTLVASVLLNLDEFVTKE